MKLDEDVSARLRLAAESLHIDATRSLERLHRSRPRRQAIRRVATVVTALAVAAAGLSIAWLARPIHATSPRPASDEPIGTIAYMNAIRDGYRGSVDALTFGASPVTIAGTGFADYPVWSPDGSRIAYGVGADYDHTRLTVADANGTSATTLSDRALRGPCGWSPDGTHIAYIHDVNADGYTGAVFVADVATGHETLVLPGWWQSVSWSPDGQRLLVAGHPQTSDNAYSEEGFDLYTVRPDGTDLTRLTHTPGYEHIASWSPDGSRIVFVRSATYDDGAYQSDVWVMNADGSDQRQLTDWRGFDSYPVWSPDGAWIAFTSDRDATPAQQQAEQKGDAFGANSLFIMRPDGTDVRRILTATADQTFAPTSWKR